MDKITQSWIDYFIPAQIKENIEEVKRLRLFIYICGMTVLFVSISSLLSLYQTVEYGASNYVGPAVVLLYGFLPFAVKYSKNSNLPIYAGFAFAFVAITHRSFNDEFLYSTTLLWLMSIPALAMTILERKKSFPILIASFINLTAIGFFHYKEIGFAAKDPQLFVTYLFVMFFIALTSHLFNREKEIVHDKYLELQSHSHKKERLSMLGEMVAGLAHEINNPLTIIVASSNLIEKEILLGHSDENSITKTMRLNQKISFHAGRINRLIASLREYSKSENEIKKDYISLNDLILTIPKGREEQFMKLGIEFRIRNSSEEIIGYVNYLMIKHAILNLVENSIDAVTQYEERWIEIELKTNQKDVEILVTDSGTGIPLEYQEKIMNAFFTTKEVGKGVGIGLLLSSRYIELNLGALRFNKDAKNTQFIISLPFVAHRPNFAKENENSFNLKKAA